MDSLPQDDSDPRGTLASKSQCHFVHKFDGQSLEIEIQHHLSQKFSFDSADKKQSDM